MTLPHLPRSRRPRSPLPAPPPKDQQCHRRIPAVSDAGLTFVRCTEMNGHREDHVFPTTAGIIRIPKGRR